MPRGENLDKVRGNTMFKAGAEQVEIARKGGKTAQKKARERKLMGDIAKELMGMQVTSKKLKDLMKSMGFMEEDCTYQAALVVSIAQKALGGDVKAAQMIRELAGEDPMVALKQQELVLKQEEVQNAISLNVDEQDRVVVYIPDNGR